MHYRVAVNLSHSEDMQVFSSICTGLHEGVKLCSRCVISQAATQVYYTSLAHDGSCCWAGENRSCGGQEAGAMAASGITSRWVIRVDATSAGARPHTASHVEPNALSLCDRGSLAGSKLERRALATGQQCGTRMPVQRGSGAGMKIWGDVSGPTLPRRDFHQTALRWLSSL